MTPSTSSEQDRREQTSWYMRVREAARRALVLGVSLADLETAICAAAAEVEEARQVLEP